eukprot:m.60027 g.60027  ORF g.60027 m.60027 type:complete len:88 (-) comp6999_c0_seq1:176-439(-)
MPCPFRGLESEDSTRTGDTNLLDSLLGNDINPTLLQSAQQEDVLVTQFAHLAKDSFVLLLQARKIHRQPLHMVFAASHSVGTDGAIQ